MEELKHSAVWLVWAVRPVHQTGLNQQTAAGRQKKKEEVEKIFL